MQIKIYQKLILVVLVLMISCTQENCKDLPYLIAIGKKQDQVFLSTLKDERVYSFIKGDFYIIKEAKLGYTACFINDSCEIYKSTIDTNPNLLCIKNGRSLKFNLSLSPDWVCANTDCSKIYFSDGLEVDRIKILDTQTGQISRGVNTYYEGFWFVNEYLIYSEPNYTSNNALLTNKLYMGNGFDTIGRKLIISQDFYLYEKINNEYTLGYKYNNSLSKKERYIILNRTGILSKISSQLINDNSLCFECNGNLIFYTPNKNDSIIEIKLPSL